MPVYPKSVRVIDVASSASEDLLQREVRNATPTPKAKSTSKPKKELTGTKENRGKEEEWEE